MPSYEDFEGTKGLVGFEKTVGEALARSELGGISDGYMLSHAGGNSGYTFGGNQMDLGKGKDWYWEKFEDIIYNAKDENGETIVPNPQDFLDKHSDALNSTGNPHALSQDDKDIIDDALSSDYGRNIINQAFAKDIGERIDHVHSIINNLPDGETKEALLNSEEMQLYLIDYDNQLGLQPGKTMDSFLRGETVTVDGDVHQINGAVTPEDLLGFIEDNKEFVNHPNEFTQRYEINDAQAIEERNHEIAQAVEEENHQITQAMYDHMGLKSPWEESAAKEEMKDYLEPAPEKSGIEDTHIVQATVTPLDYVTVETEYVEVTASNPETSLSHDVPNVMQDFSALEQNTGDPALSSSLWNSLPDTPENEVLQVENSNVSNPEPSLWDTVPDVASQNTSSVEASQTNSSLWDDIADVSDTNTYSAIDARQALVNPEEHTSAWDTVSNDAADTSLLDASVTDSINLMEIDASSSQENRDHSYDLSFNDSAASEQPSHDFLDTASPQQSWSDGVSSSAESGIFGDIASHEGSGTTWMDMASNDNNISNDSIDTHSTWGDSIADSQSSNDIGI